jgi:outer membrane protein OmpA-like peptidoglycan-associated protein
MIARLALAALLLPALALAGPPADDAPGVKDTTLFTRMPGFSLRAASHATELQFDRFEFKVAEGKKVAKVAVEGRTFRYRYTLDPASGPKPSSVQIMRNYQAAARQAGGEVLLDLPNETTLRLKRADAEIWAFVQTSHPFTVYNLTIVERAAMKQDVTASAEQLRAGLTASGHVEVPGLLFDTGQSVLRAESEGALAEVVKLLGAAPAVKVWVVGHTDNVGTAASNEALSAARADTVVKALVARGIAPARLAPFGNGPYAPVASNASDEGRARNRRVELVAQ